MVKAPDTAKQKIKPPMVLSDNADVGDLQQAATENGLNLNMCITSLNAAQEHFKVTGQ